MQETKTIFSNPIPKSILLLYKLKKIENSIVELNKMNFSETQNYKYSIEKIENQLKDLKNYL